MTPNPPIEQSVEQMNEVIAVFDGWEQLDKRYGQWKKLRYGGNVFVTIDHFRYHDDWGELHRAWNKFYQLYETEIQYKNTVEPLMRFINPMSKAMVTNNITSAHRILYDAVEWVKNK